MIDENYYWVRVFDYDYERDLFDKGVLLDEFYLKGLISREDAKKEVREKYNGETKNNIKFAKPKKKASGVYAILMDSNRFYYDRLYATIDTICFWCHKPVIGKASEFPKSYIGNSKYGVWEENDGMTDLEKTAYFCSYDCKKIYHSNIYNSEGEFQEKEAGENGDIFGYIYLIYNRTENTFYVGQTRFMPFFRWQEHVKDGKKGDIKDLSFSVLTEVRKNRRQNDEQNQLYLNSIEAWWIAKYQEEGHKVFNISNPKITVESLKRKFDEMIKKNKQVGIFELTQVQ